MPRRCRPVPARDSAEGPDRYDHPARDRSVTFTAGVDPGHAEGRFPGRARTCGAAYSETYQWPGGFQAQVNVTNTGTAAITGWRVTWTFPSGQTITQYWNASVVQSGSGVIATNLGFNAAFGLHGADLPTSKRD